MKLHAPDRCPFCRKPLVGGPRYQAYYKCGAHIWIEMDQALDWRLKGHTGTCEEKEIRQEDKNNPIIVRSLPLKKAKEEIACYFRENDGREIGYDELIEKLRIEPSIVVEACAELEAEGKIG